MSLKLIFELHVIINNIKNTINGHFFLSIPDKPKRAVVKYIFASNINVHNDPFTADGNMLLLKTLGTLYWFKIMILFIKFNIFIFDK